MRNIIAGTAGHIDHGKTALVRALTGVDTDRLEEEKRRGISIDLGFASLRTDGVQFGFVDVPGHERFVKNMLAGAGGIDLVILVIAAEEGVKPQTREHFDICRLLGIRHGLVALTKADLVDAETLELVRLEVADFVAGSFLDGAPIIPVSSKTGLGLDALRQALIDLAWKTPARPLDGAFRLAIDRSFTMHGFGTVVTGTMWSGRLRAGDEVEVHPGGRRLRVRGLQVHGGAVSEAQAGQRTAVNLAGVESADLRRGMTLAPPGWFESTTAIDCTFSLLPNAAPLRYRAPVHFHAGTAESEAEVRFIDGQDSMKPGESRRLRLLLKEPVLLLPGDHFIVRMFSPVVTIGGGVVLDNKPPLKLRKSAQADRLAKFAMGALETRVAMIATEHPEGASVSALVARTGETAERILKIAGSASLAVLKNPDPWLIGQDVLARHAAKVRDAVAAFHKQNPLLPGLPKSSVVLPGFLLDAVLDRHREIVADGDILRLASHKLSLKSDEDEALGRMEGLFRDAGLAVPAVNDVLAQSGLDLNRARSLLQILMRQRKLLRVSADLTYHADALAQLKSLLEGKKGAQFSVGEFKDWTGVSRKYAIPLLEFLDRLRVTRREGDKRVVL